MTIQQRPGSIRSSQNPPARTAWLLAGTLLVLFSGCGDDGRPEPASDAESPAGADQGIDARVRPPADVEVEPPDAEADAPPAARPCRTTVGSGPGLTLRGTVLTPATVLPDGEVLLDTTTGRIACVSEDCSGRPEALDGTLLCTDGIVLPGLIDVHDHIAYGILPRWNHEGRLFLHRYDWQASALYRDFVRPYEALRGSQLCRMDKYGEVRMALGGATSVQGSAGAAACADPILRNLDMTDVHGLAGWAMRERVSHISGLSDSAAADLRAGLADGTIDVFVTHVGEGIDESSRAELDRLADLDLMLPRTAVVHATGARTIELARMAAAGTALLWSPRSNLDLYGLTTDVPTARNLGVRVAVGPDWLPSGSAGVLDELKCVDDLDRTWYDDSWTDRQLVEAVTSVAADALHAAAFVGRLEAGLLADVTVVRGNREDPYRAVIDAAPADVVLVLRGGRLLAGDPALAAPLSTPLCETVDACGAPRTVCVRTGDSRDDGRDETLADITARLRAALDDARRDDDAYDPADPSTTYAYELAPLLLCSPPPPCRPGRGEILGAPTVADRDGDGTPNASDVCPAVFDPGQSDFDGDGAGDACDPCPLDPGSLACPPPDPTDVDRDGVADVLDNCPDVQNPAQVDTDGDGRGDACEPTAITIFDLQDGSRPRHPPEGSAVFVDDVVVTAAYRRGVFVEEPDGGPFAGILVYTGSSTGLEPGDRVDVGGTYREYAGASEIASPTIVRLGSGAPPPPRTVRSADVATGGAFAEAYEGVLIAVEDVTVTDPNPDAPADYGEFRVTGGLRVDDLVHAVRPAPAAGDAFARIAGVLHFSYGEFKLEPRSAADVAP